MARPEYEGVSCVAAGYWRSRGEDQRTSGQQLEKKQISPRLYVAFAKPSSRDYCNNKMEHPRVYLGSFRSKNCNANRLN